MSAIATGLRSTGARASMATSRTLTLATLTSGGGRVFVEALPALWPHPEASAANNTRSRVVRIMGMNSSVARLYPIVALMTIAFVNE